MEAYEAVFRKATGKDPFPYQVVAATQAELPRLIRAPTGAGKTAAAVMAWLYRRRFHPDSSVRGGTPRRLVYCLPIRVLVEQTVDAITRWVERLGLAQEVRVFQLMGGAVDQDWVRWPERDLVLVGTMDMLLSRALNRGYAAPRSRWPIEFGLLNNDCFWVLDEVQLMGNGLAASAQLEAFRRIYRTHRPCSSLWMSATVDREWLRTVDHEPPTDEITVSENDLGGPLGARARATKLLIPLDVRRWPDDIADAVLRRHQGGTLTLVVVNTVARARELYAFLRHRVPTGIELCLLHSQFRPPDRQRALRTILSDPPAGGRIVISTQVVEAGIDVSAATLVTELAPWGSLVQRFGRCNRFGELQHATVVWVDVDDNESAPYSAEELREARERLKQLEGQSVSPENLERLGPGRPPRVRHVLRRTDLLDLFDTEPDLAGNDVDISRFIRDDADGDVHIFWRRWTGDFPPPELARPSAAELCPVPVWEVRQFLRERRESQFIRAFVWDHLERSWRAVADFEVRPGGTLLLPANSGGYSPETGWNRDWTTPVDPLDIGASIEPEESMDDEPAEEITGAWVTLEAHGSHVRRQAESLLGALDIKVDPWEKDALLVAALWHDAGKAHPVFQDALLKMAPDAERDERKGSLWAKSAYAHTRPNYARPHFRHELASGLALLAAPADRHKLGGQTLDLAAYLVVAHHGKVRCAIRSLPGERRPEDPRRRFARGVWDGDQLGPVQLEGAQVPRLSLDLSVMDAGRGPNGEMSWSERVLRLRDTLGPFRLAHLEALLRIADWGASAQESGQEHDPPGGGTAGVSALMGVPHDA